MPFNIKNGSINRIFYGNTPIRHAYDGQDEFFEAISYVVTFKQWDGTTLKTETVWEHGAATAPSNPGREGYTFVGWNTAFDDVTSDITVTATFSIEFYTVTFKDWNDTVIATVDVAYGGNATPPTSPTRTGYNFVSWSGTYTNMSQNETVLATYSIKAFRVRFYDWDGTLLSSNPVNYGSDATAPSNPSRTGYTFNSWSGTYTNITSATDITATYTIKSFTVNWYDWDDTLLKTESVNYGSSATPPTDPTRSGYRFTSWDTSYGSITANTDITTLYIQQFTVTFYDYDGTTVLKTHVVDIHADATPPIPPPTRTGYTFSGWSGTFQGVTSNRTITATYSIKTFTVVFQDWDRTLISMQTVNYGSDAVAPANPTRPGYIFDSWDSSYTNVKSSRTITAQYYEATFRVRFYDWNHELLVSEIVAYGEDATPPPNPTKEGGYFVGWDIIFTNVTQNLDVYALYTGINYTVTWRNWNNTILKTESVNYGQDGTPPTSPSRTGYDFTGWSPSYTNITANKTIYAQYSIKTFTVRFYDCMSNIHSQQTVNYGGNAIAPTNPLNEGGYIFGGWNQPSSYWQNVTSNLYIYAICTMGTVEYSVTWKDWDGSNLKVELVVEGDNATPPSNPTRLGYTFTGWSASYTNVQSNLIIFAEYELAPSGKIWIGTGPQSYVASFTEHAVPAGDYNDVYIGCATSNNLANKYLPDANNYNVGNVVRIKLYYLYLDMPVLCGSFAYFKCK